MRNTNSAQDTALAATDRRTSVRVKLEDPDGAMQDIGDLSNEDFFDALTISANVDNPVSSATLTLWRAAAALSLAPLMEGSTLNRSGSTYAPFLDVTRAMTVEVATMLAGQTPSAGDWVMLWEGYVDDIDWASERITIQARDPIGRLNDTIIETTTSYGGGSPLADIEDVMQSILNDNMGSGEYPLVVVGTPDFGIKSYDLGNVSVLDALMALADLQGWSLHWKWDATASPEDFFLTYYEPVRNAVDLSGYSPDYTFSADDYYGVQQLKLSSRGIRNAGEVVYTDTDGAEQSVASSRSSSIAKYDRRFIRLDEQGGSISTSTQATAMLNAVLDDLEVPRALQRIEAAFHWPIELGDMHRYEANGVHYDTDQDWAVRGYTHILEPTRVRTLIDVAGKPAGGYSRWHQRELGSSDIDEVSVRATDELYSVGVSGSDQGWKRELILECGPGTKSVEIAVGSYVEALGIDDGGWPSQLVNGWSYTLDVTPNTTVRHTVQDSSGSSDAVQTVRYDEGNLLPGGRTFNVTITPHSQSGGGGVAGSSVTVLTRDFETYDSVGFRTTETMDRRIDGNDTPGLGGFDLDMDADANGFAFEWTNNAGEAVEISQVRFYVKSTGSPGGPGSLTADIYEDSAGLPGTFLAESVAVDPTTIGAAYEAVTFDFSTPVTVADGVTVHIGAVYASGDASNYLSVEADDAGSHSELNGSWAAGAADREPLWRLYIEDEVERFARRSIPGTNVKSTLNPATGELEFDLADTLQIESDNDTGEGLVYAAFIITDSAAVDTAAGLAIRNIGHSDNLYLEVSGKPTGASAPTGLGIDLNKEAGGSGEESSQMAGFGIQIFDHSTTDQGVNGPHMIYLLKSGNMNSEHPALEIAANRHAIRVIDDPDEAGYDGTLQLISHWRADTGAERWRFTADGYLLFVEDDKGLLFQFSTGNQGAIKVNDTDDTVDHTSGPEGVRFLDNAGSNVNVHLTDEGTINMRVRTSDPGNAIQGTLAYADGSSWDPGSGEGVYRFDGTSWVHLG